MYAQGNASRFPGLDREGHDAGISVEHRMWVLLASNYFTGEYAVSPAETKTAWTTGTLTTDQYSHAMLQLPVTGARRAEWAETLNADAIVVSDRNVGTVEAPRSIHPPRANGWGCTEGAQTWIGGVAYNDNHVVFESSHRLPTVMSGVAFASDHLFTAEGGSDVWMIYSGDGR